MNINCSNPSLAIDFDGLPRETDEDDDTDSETDNDTDTDSDTNSATSEQYQPSNDEPYSISDRFDQEVEETNLLPQKFECGSGHQSVNRVFGGDFTGIWEFPWY